MSCRVPSSPSAATDKTFSDNKPHSVFSFENNSSHFFIFALRRLIHTGDNIGPVFHFKLRPCQCVCVSFLSSLTILRSMLRIPIKIFPEYFGFNLIDHIWNQGQTYLRLSENSQQLS